jgi:hypothetical protein
MHTNDTINLGRALAEVIFGLLIAIALHLGLPEAAVARLRARMAVTAEEWEVLYTAWLAARLAPVSVHPRRIRRPKTNRQANAVARNRRRSSPRGAACRTTPRPSPVRPQWAAASSPSTLPIHWYVPTGQPRNFRVWPAGPTHALNVTIT